MNNVVIKIHYTGPAGRSERSGSFPLRGKTAAEVAYDWWFKDVGRGYERVLDKVTADGEDITDKVIEVKKKIYKDLGLPF